MMKLIILTIFLCTMVQAKPKARATAKTFLPKTFSADLVQSHKSSISGKIKKSKGKIYFQTPNKIRIKSSKPTETVFVSNKSKTWFYRAPLIKGENGELRIEKNGTNQIAKFFFLLRKGLSSNELYDVIKKGENYTLIFKEATARQLGFLEADFSFKKGMNPSFENIEKMRVKSKNKKYIDLEFLKLKKNIKLKSELFQFVVPPNTRVIQARVKKAIKKIISYILPANIA